MPTASHESAPRAYLFERVAAVAALVTVMVAGCTGKADTGSAESPAATPTMASQIAGLTAMNLVFVANPNGNDQIFEQSLSTPNEPPVALTDPKCRSENPQAYPGGKRLVYYTDCGDGNQVVTLDLISHVGTQLTHDTGVQNYDPTCVLGPDNEVMIAWKRSDLKGDYGDLWDMNVDGSNQHVLTPGLIAAKREAWKPTGAGPGRVIFTVRERQGDPNSDELYSLNLADGTMRQETDNHVPDWFPTYNAGQDKVVAITRQDGHDVLVIMNPDGTDRRVIVAMPGDTDDPSWAPQEDMASNGGELPDGLIVYINNGGGKYKVYAEDLATGQQALVYNGRIGRALAPILVPAAAG